VDLWWLLVPASYVFGGFPTARLIGHLTGTDPTSEGSGNPGASNMYRVAGKRAGAAVLVGDMLKGFIPTAIGVAAGGRPLGVACALAAIAGHILPIRRKLHLGGKGVATLGGACWFLYPIVSLGLVVIWLVTMRLFRTASVGSLTMLALLPIGIALRGRPAWEIAAMSLAAALVAARHWPNIRRIARHEERSLRRRSYRSKGG
jgi:glycerol-3-phosphate acyltransferase PlsY